MPIASLVLSLARNWEFLSNLSHTLQIAISVCVCECVFYVLLIGLKCLFDTVCNKNPILPHSQMSGQQEGCYDSPQLLAGISSSGLRLHSHTVQLLIAQSIIGPLHCNQCIISLLSLFISLGMAEHSTSNSRVQDYSGQLRLVTIIYYIFRSEPQGSPGHAVVHKSLTFHHALTSDPCFQNQHSLSEWKVAGPDIKRRIVLKVVIAQD